MLRLVILHHQQKEKPSLIYFNCLAWLILPASHAQRWNHLGLFGWGFLFLQSEMEDPAPRLLQLVFDLETVSRKHRGLPWIRKDELIVSYILHVYMYLYIYIYTRTLCVDSFLQPRQEPIQRDRPLQQKRMSVGKQSVCYHYWGRRHQLPLHENSGKSSLTQELVGKGSLDIQQLWCFISNCLSQSKAFWWLLMTYSSPFKGSPGLRWNCPRITCKRWSRSISTSSTGPLQWSIVASNDSPRWDRCWSGPNPVLKGLLINPNPLILYVSLTGTSSTSDTT